MTAVVDIREWNGTSPGTPTTKTSGTIQFKRVDDAAVESPIENPVLKDPNPSNFTTSYEKWLRLRIGSPGPAWSITSPRVYSDGTYNFLADVKIKAGVAGETFAPDSPFRPIASPSTYATVDFITYIESSPLALDATIPDQIFNGSNVDIADFLVLQGEVKGSSPDTNHAIEPIFIAYDEV